MHRLRHLMLPALLLLSSTSLHAEEASTTTGSSDEELVEYLKNLGAYLGYDITVAPNEGEAPVASLLDVSNTTLAQQYAFITLLGAIPVNAANEALAYFVPTDTENYSLINDMANYTFATQPSGGVYSDSSGGEQGSISVSALIDQATYQPDPVTQAALNGVATPNTTYCLNNDVTDVVSDCEYLYDSLVMANVIGTIPNTNDFFSYDYNQSIMTQLNSNTLVAPLMYTTDTESSTSSSSTDDSENPGLTALNQAQEAANFIRYATAAVSPIDLPKKADYDALYSTAVSDSSSDLDKLLAEQGIAKYLTKLRTFTAQASIVSNNLYASLSKRMPQAQSSSGSTKTSEALSEYQMATRRLYDPAKGSSSGSSSDSSSSSSSTEKQWVDQINEASTATVQKEIAVLLSEMNYQLYLSRQLQEREVIALSLILRQAMQKPSFKNESKIEITSDG